MACPVEQATDHTVDLRLVATRFVLFVSGFQLPLIDVKPLSKVADVRTCLQQQLRS